MPFKKSALKLEDLCWKTILLHFEEIKQQAELLPSHFIAELFKQCCNCNLFDYRNGNVRFPAKLFIHPKSKKLDKLNFFDLPEDEIMNKISQTCTSLRELTISFQCDYTAIMCNNPHLIHLDLRESPVTNENLAVIGKNCPQLKKLVLNDCQNITDEGMKYLPPNITSLCLYNSSVTEKGCIIALNLLHSLDFLLHSRSWTDILRMLQKENSRKKYSIEYMNFYFRNQSDVDVCSVVSGLFPKLQQITFFNFESTVVAIGPLTYVLHNNITRLYLRFFPISIIKIIGNLCPMLEDMDISFSDELFQLQFEITEHVTYKHLRSLSINIRQLILPRADFLMMFENCCQLMILNIYDHDQLLDELLIDLMRVNPLHHLWWLSFSRCNFITIESMTAVVKSLTSLCTLCITECGKILDTEFDILKELIQRNNWDVTLHDWSVK